MYMCVHDMFTWGKIMICLDGKNIMICLLEKISDTQIYKYMYINICICVYMIFYTK